MSTHYRCTNEACSFEAVVKGIPDVAAELRCMVCGHPARRYSTDDTGRGASPREAAQAHPAASTSLNAPSQQLASEPIAINSADSDHSPATPLSLGSGDVLYPKASVSPSAVELRVEGGIHAKHFDYFHRRLLVQHERRGIEKLSAWSLDDWQPVAPSLGFDVPMIAQHHLAAALGHDLEYSLETVCSSRSPAGTFWKVGVSEPKGACGIDRRRAQLIWDTARGQWVGGMLARETDDLQFQIGRRHLAMTRGYGAKSLRLVPWTDGTTPDLDSPLCERQLGEGAVSLAFAPDDRYVVAQRGPGPQAESRLRAPLELQALRPDSAFPIWETRYSRLGSREDVSWQCVGTWISPSSALLGVILTREPQPRYMLYDLTTGRLVAPPICCASRLKMAIACLPRFGLVTLLREPNLLEVWQFGVAEPLLRVDLEAEQPGSSGRVGAQLCPEGHYLAVHFTDRPLLKIYKFEFADTPIRARLSDDERLWCPSVEPDWQARPRDKAKTAANDAQDEAMQVYSIDHLIADPPELPPPSPPPRKRRKPARNHQLQDRLILALGTLLFGYALSIGPVAALNPQPAAWVVRVYSPHRAVAKQPQVARALKQWCQWWRVTEEATEAYLGLAGESPSEAPAEVPTTTVASRTDEPTEEAPASTPRLTSDESVERPRETIEEAGVSLSSSETQRAIVAKAGPPLVTKSAAERATGGKKGAEQAVPTRSIPGIRIWTDMRGRMVEASMVDVEGSDVIFALPDGTRRRSPIDRLSARDQDYVRRWREER